MSSFTEALEYRWVDDTETMAESMREFRYYECDTMVGWYFRCPKGALSNLGSVPAIGVSLGIDPKDPYYAQVFFMHDLCVGEHGLKYPMRNNETGEIKYLSWIQAANLMAKALETQDKKFGINTLSRRLRRTLIISSVKAYGLVRKKKYVRLMQ